MKIRESIDFNIQMTKHLFQASPRYFLVNLLNTVFHTGSYMFQVLFYKYTIDAVVYQKETFRLVVLHFALYYMILTFSDMVNSVVQIRFNNTEKIKIARYYKNMICRESVQNGIRHFESEKYADKLHNAAYHDGDYLYAFSEKVFDLVNAILLFGFFFGLLLSLQPVFIVMAALTAIKNIACADKENKLKYEKYQVSLLFDRLDRYIYNIFYLKQYTKELRLYSIGDFFIEKFKLCKKLCWENKKQSQYKETFVETISELSDLLFQIINISVLVWLLIRGRITVGEFSLILTNLALVANQIQRVLMFLPGVYDDARYISDIFSIMNMEKRVYPRVNDGEGKNVKDKEVLFQNVCFSYDGENMVLNDINVRLPLDKKIALVGENGSGKSTFIKLLLGLYEPTQGNISYQYGENQSCHSLQLFSPLIQDFQIFDLSIADNIAPGENMEAGYLTEIEKALQFSGLAEKVESLPYKADTILSGEFSEEGVGLSGGELQKLAIARAYAGKKPVLVLDEPTARLDAAAENRFMQKINELAEERAVILTTHNIGCTQNVDLVFVFDKGSIVEYGSPKDLISKRGCYYKMLQEQIKTETQASLDSHSISYGVR